MSSSALQSIASWAPLETENTTTGRFSPFLLLNFIMFREQTSVLLLLSFGAVAMLELDRGMLCALRVHKHIQLLVQQESAMVGLSSTNCAITGAGV